MATRKRHWKQIFDAEADFVFVNFTKYGGHVFESGDPVDKEMFPGHKLKKAWKDGLIELALWEAPIIHNPHYLPPVEDTNPNQPTHDDLLGR